MKYSKILQGLLLLLGLLLQHRAAQVLFLGALSSIAGGLASNLIDNVEFNKVKKLLQNADSSDLNHDLQKNIIQAVEWAILNIQILYKKEGLEKPQIRELNEFTKSLIGEVKTLNSQLSKEEGKLYKIVEAPENDQKIFKTFDLKVDTFPDIYSGNPYNKFFKKHFTANMQLCFGELLKSNKNRPGLIAYQREVYQNLDTSVSKIISQNEKILEKLTVSDEREVITKKKQRLGCCKNKSRTNLFRGRKPRI